MTLYILDRVIFWSINISAREIEKIKAIKLLILHYPLNLTLIDDSDYLINRNEVVSRFKTPCISRKS
jgi:hypothetical protein